MVEITVGPGVTVSLHFSLTLDDGGVVDSNFDDKPASFTVGDGKLLPGFEKALFGLQAGDRRQLYIPPEQGFGQRNPNNLQTIPRSAFQSEITPVEGLVVSFADAAGGEMPGVIKQVGQDEVVIDFNHPLAGRTITFDVHILDVQPAVRH